MTASTLAHPDPQQADTAADRSIEPLLDVDRIRRSLRRAAAAGGAQGRLWQGVRRLARERPDEHPWFVPFVAVVERDAALMSRARAAIRSHLDRAQEEGCSGYLFNIWCFAFPHARWAVWFDLLRRAGAYEPEEAAREAARFLLIQHRDHHAGLRVKPHPECVDNQVLALALSSLLVGTLFADEPHGRNLARLLRDEAAARVDAILGGVPPSGYTGEGSTYQNLIVAFAVPLLTELLERVHGGNAFDTPFPPNGTSPHAVLRATARLWMPGGLLLPWDAYGYQPGVRVPLAYLARRTGDRQIRALLEQVAAGARINSEPVGWGHDEPVWALAYWPEETSPAPPVWTGWTERELGGVRVSPDGRRYLMQMWDPTQAFCVREHVNPNSVLLEADGVPLCADGTPVRGRADPLAYPDARVERHYGPGSTQTVNLSLGCGGSHGGILIDGREGLRPAAAGYDASVAVESPGDRDAVTGDVTGLYRSVHPDARCVRRRSRLIENAYWLVEDLVHFTCEHRVTCRWWFRPDVRPVPGGFDQMTHEGVGVQVRSLLAPAQSEVVRVDGYPMVPDRCSDRVDVHQTGRVVRWLWLLWPVAQRRRIETYDDGWDAIPIATGADVPRLDFGGAVHAVAPGTPPWLQGADVPVEPTWAFRRILDPVASDNAWFCLPRGLHSGAELWIDGAPAALEGPPERRDLLPTYVRLPAGACRGRPVEIRLRLRFAVGHRAPYEKAVCHPAGPPSLWVESDPSARLQTAAYADGRVTIRTLDGTGYQTAHVLMAGEGAPA